MPDVLDAVEAGEVDLGFVADRELDRGHGQPHPGRAGLQPRLLIQREVVLDIEHCLLARRAPQLADVKVVLSIPVATAQCHAYLRQLCPAPSAGRELDRRGGSPGRRGARSPGSAAVAPRVAGRAVRPRGPRGRTSPITPATRRASCSSPSTACRRRPATTAPRLVVYQRADEPGSLISILQEFAARRINLSNLLSRPTKDGGLGDYCFIIYADGHIDDEVVADAVRSLHAKQGPVEVPRLVPGRRRARPPRPRARRLPLARGRRLGRVTAARDRLALAPELRTSSHRPLTLMH